MDKKRILLISTGILAGSLIFTGYQAKIPYKNQVPSQQGITNTINVAGEGKAYVIPDTLVINASISELAPTTKEAQTQANDKVQKVKDILESFTIAKENIKTQSVNIYPEYDRTNNQRKLLGYRAQQSLSIEVSGDDFGQKGSDIISKIADVGGINIDNTQFTLKDKNTAMEAARTKAFEDAEGKAKQLAKLGGVMLGKPTMITDQEISYYPGPIMYAMDKAMGAGETAMNNAPLSPGQTEVTIRLNVVYEIK